MKFQQMNRTQQQIAKVTFIGMLQREMQFTQEQAAQEFAFLVSNLTQINRDFYTIRQPRIGATQRLNRIQKNNVYSMFENSLNHATFVV